MTKSILTILIVAAISIGCQTGTSNTNKAANTANSANTANTAANAPASNSPAADNTKPANTDAKTTAPAADSPTAAYKAAYAARKNKDIKALKQLLAKDMIEFFEIMGEGKPNPLDEGLKELCETPQGPSDDARNEKIDGNRATVEFLNAKGEWSTMDLIKEGGAWKLTIGDMSDKKPKK